LALTGLLLKETSELAARGFKGPPLLFLVAAIWQRATALHDFEHQITDRYFSQRRRVVQPSNEFTPERPQVVDVFAYMQFLAHWARKLSWKEVAES